MRSSSSSDRDDVWFRDDSPIEGEDIVEVSGAEAAAMSANFTVNADGSILQHVPFNYTLATPSVPPFIEPTYTIPLSIEVNSAAGRRDITFRGCDLCGSLVDPIHWIKHVEWHRSEHQRWNEASQPRYIVSVDPAKSVLHHNENNPAQPKRDMGRVKLPPIIPNLTDRCKCGHERTAHRSTVGSMAWWDCILCNCKQFYLPA